MSYPIQDVIEAYRVAQCREDFQKYVAATNKEFTFGFFNRLLALELTNFYRDYQLGLNPRLMIFAPPRSGKSQMASRHLPAWLFGRDPKMNIIACSYAAELAETMSLDVRRLMSDQEHLKIFPQAAVYEGKDRPNRGDLWGTSAGGVYRSAGVAGPLTGQGFSIGIIDDPVKSAVEASSEITQRRHQEWYSSVFYTRRNPIKNGIILIQTRWHPNDLGGQLLAAQQHGGDRWRVLKFPMEATEDEFHEIDGRKIKLRKAGQILFPERMPPDYVKECKNSLPFVWNALYQQNPVISGGGVIPIKEFRTYRTIPTDYSITQVCITCDTALTVKKSSDYSVFECWFKTASGHAHLAHMLRGKWTGPELLQKAREMWAWARARDWGPTVRPMAIHIEEAAAGYGLIQALKAGTPSGLEKPGEVLQAIPVIGLPTTKDKLTRVTNFGPALMSGTVVIPEDAPWRKEFLDECESFTANDSHAHDDMIDAMAYAIDILLGTDSQQGHRYDAWKNLKW